MIKAYSFALAKIKALSATLMRIGKVHVPSPRYSVLCPHTLVLDSSSSILDAVILFNLIKL